MPPSTAADLQQVRRPVQASRASRPLQRTKLGPRRPSRRDSTCHHLGRPRPRQRQSRRGSIRIRSSSSRYVLILASRANPGLSLCPKDRVYPEIDTLTLLRAADHGRAARSAPHARRPPRNAATATTRHAAGHAPRHATGNAPGHAAHLDRAARTGRGGGSGRRRSGGRRVLCVVFDVLDQYTVVRFPVNSWW